MSIKSYIYAASSYIPDQVVKSEDLMDELKSESNLGISRTLINDKVGIFERRNVGFNEEKHSVLAFKAAERLINDHNIDVDDIDCVIYCGIERDYCEPGTSHVIQSKLGL